MTVNYTKNLETQVYKDDFDPDKGFHKVLFKSGKALQSRELNQLQSIIQEEIKRLGTNLLKKVLHSSLLLLPLIIVTDILSLTQIQLIL